LRLDEPKSETEPAIAAAVIISGGRVLLLRRAVAEGSLLWTLPSGEVEFGETDEEAAVREVWEETGLRVVAGAVIGRRIHPATGRQMVYVACEVEGGMAHVAAPDEVSAVEWCGRARLAELVPGGLFESVATYLGPLLVA
jgi:8-oxo-dGTP diphosphatase